MPTLRLYNSLNRTKHDFKPLDPGHIKIYACGPTVYDYAHIGNARMAVVFDMLARLLRTLYPKVTYASNITDIEDKIIRAAKEAKCGISEITTKFSKIYNRDMAALNVLPPDIQPFATDHIDEMVSLITKLIDEGKAYEKEGHVLFNVPSYQAYGQLSGRSREDQIDGARVEVAPYKKDPADFILWKPSDDDQPGWDSPWGRGRPGWHIECSAMSEKHLGLPFDIHGGGADLKFPHHENEIAQSCAAHRLPPEDFARYWVHNGFVTVEGEKMSKSLGNFLLVHDLIEKYPGEVLRLTLLSAHYRQPLDWSESKILQNKKLLDRLYARLYEMRDIEATDESVPVQIIDALCDDLNTPQVAAEISVILKEENSPQLKGQLKAIGGLLGIMQDDPAQWLGYDGAGAAMSDAEIQKLLDERAEARANKDFARSDEIRDHLKENGIVIEDTPDGAKWRVMG